MISWAYIFVGLSISCKLGGISCKFGQHKLQKNENIFPTFNKETYELNLRDLFSEMAFQLFRSNSAMPSNRVFTGFQLEAWRSSKA